MLKKSRDKKAVDIYRGLDIRYYVKGNAQEIESQPRNSSGVIIDPFKKKGTVLEIYNDAQYMTFFTGIERKEILAYLNSLPKGDIIKLIPNFIHEAGLYFANPNIFAAYADFLQAHGHISQDDLVNHLLLGGDYTSAAKLIDSAKEFTIGQKVKILELANQPRAAYDFCLKNDPKNYEKLYRLATLSGMTEEAYQHYLKLDPGDTQTLTRLSYQTGNFNRALEHARVMPLDDEYMLDLFVKTDSNYDALLTAVKINDPRASQFADKLTDTDKNRAFDYFVEKNESLRASYVRFIAKLPETRLTEIRSGIDAEINRLINDPGINHQIVLEKEFGKDVKVWTLQKAFQAKKLRPDVKLDLGDYYELAGNHEAAYMYYLASHQYIKAIIFHQKHLSISLEPISYEHFRRAGMEAEANEDLDLAISLYLKAGTGNDQKLSDLYRSIKDLDNAISYQYKADPNAYQRLAELYELKNDYENATNYYIKANLGYKAFANAQMIQPTNWTSLIETNQLAGRSENLQTLLEGYYNKDYLNAGTEYIKYGKSSQYLDMVITDSKWDALDKHNLYSEINVQKLDELINAYPESILSSEQKKIVAERLKHYEIRIDELNLTELDTAMILAKRINDNKRSSAFLSQQQKVRARIAEEERKKKEEREKRKNPAYACNLIKGTYSGSGYFYSNDYISIYSDGSYRIVSVECSPVDTRGKYSIDQVEDNYIKIKLDTVPYHSVIGYQSNYIYVNGDNLRWGDSYYSK
jgi:hypothetical protein